MGIGGGAHFWCGVGVVQDKFEGDLRFSHNLVRTFCESIAFYGGEHLE
jgi:hypothetical protein